MLLPRSSSFMLCSQIRWSETTEFFQDQWSQYLVLQKKGHLTNITMHLKDGSISLHQAVLLPLSRLLSHSMTDTPLVLLMPDYHLSTAQSLVSLLYTGSCTPQSTACYYSLLTMLSSLGINLSPTSLVFSPTDSYHHKKFRVGTASEDLQGDYTDCEGENDSQASEIDEKPGTGDKREACRKQRLNSESMASLCSHCGSVHCVCSANGVSGITEISILDKTSQNNPTEQMSLNQLKIPKFNIKYRGNEEAVKPNLPVADNHGLNGGNSCPVCGVYLAGGMFKYRSHLVEKHFYKQLSAMLGMRVKQCPVCEKTIEKRSNLVKHFGIMHKSVDQLLNVDDNQNSTNRNTTPQDPDYLKDTPKLVIDDGQEDSKEEKTLISSVPTEFQLMSPANQFKCTLCPSSRKTQFRLLQHYSVAHFRWNLEDQFGLQFETNNGCCPVCMKIMKNLYCFLIHIGAAHGEVSQFLNKQRKHQGFNTKSQLLNSWSCSMDSCQNADFPNKCSLMRHFALKHHNQQLSAVLQPLFEADGSCHDCGKLFKSFHQFMLHCSITHRMVLAYCSQAELASLQGQLGAKQGGGRVRRMDGGRTFACKLCRKTFLNSYLLKKHYTAKHFYDALNSDFSASISSGVCQKCGQKHSGSRMVQHLGVTHNEVDMYVDDM